VHSTEQLATALAGRYRIERHLGAGGMATVYLREFLPSRSALAALMGGDVFSCQVTDVASNARLAAP
jgi:hypothetical protein